MFQINKIIFKNYIPYYNEKTFDFGENGGTSIIFGDNNIGKTSFIKGVRFLFFNDLSINPEDFNYNILVNINTKAYREQQYEFYVNMDFSYDGKKYNFMRRYVKKSSVIGEPKSDMDFEHYEVIKSEDKQYSAHERKNLIDRIIPKNISEFIFFDGENIKKYVEILNNDGLSGEENRRVKNAINDIIGTPYLDSLISHLEVIKSETMLNYKKKLKAETKDENLKKDIDKFTIEQEECIKALEAAKNNLKKENDELSSIDKEINNMSKHIEIVRDLSAAEQSKKNKETKIYEQIDDLKNEIVKMSKPMIREKLVDKKNSLEIIYNILNERKNKYIETQAKITELNKLISDDVCSLCGNDLQKSNIVSIEEKISLLKIEMSKSKFTDEEAQELNNINEQIKIINDLIKDIPSFSKQGVVEMLQTIIQDKSTVKNLSQAILSYKKELGGSPDIYQSINEKISKRDRHKKTVEEIQKRIDELQRSISELDSKIKTRTKKISGNSGSDKVYKKTEMLDNLITQFKYVKENFIKGMRYKVENSANELFMRCIEGINNDIQRIGINENYKMTIYLKNGSKIYQPSSGYNNLLALSLIYGLNKNSNLFGVIFFDAALSNLSNNYTYNIIKTLNDYAPQLVFLAHKDRINLDKTRQLLSGKIQNEFEIYQNNDSQNTMIRRI